MGKYGKRAIVVLAGIWLWTFYIFQEELSRYGLYTIISYNIHEIASVIPFLCIGIAAVWFVYLLVKVIKKESDRYDQVFLIILLAAVILIGLYIKENSNNHVLYRVTPVFDGDNLLANGVEMEAYSVEDQGQGVCFNVFVYNVQPGITIDYTTGESSK